MAVLNACDQINERLKPLREEFPNLPLSELAIKAWLRQINLSAQGHFGRPNVGYDFATKSGKPFEYFVTGAACAEVELDVLTGTLTKSKLVLTGSIKRGSHCFEY